MSNFIFIIYISILTALLCSCNTENNAPSNDYYDDIIIIDTTIKQIEYISQENIIKQEIEKILSDKRLANASVSILISLENSSNVIYSHNPNTSLVPASVMKLLTTATAMERLINRSIPRTQIQYDGEIEKNILNGNIYIKGAGDPKLGSGQRLDFMKNWVKAVKDLGIDSISGYIIADPDIFDDEILSPAWLWGELTSSYIGATSGLSINENKFSLKFNTRQPGRVKSSRENMKPFIPGITFINLTEEKNDTSPYLYTISTPYTNTIEIKGTVPKGNKDYYIRGILPDPPLAVAEEFKRQLKINGIKVNDTVTTTKLIRLNELNKIDTFIKDSLDTIYYKNNIITRTTIHNMPIINILDLITEANKNSNNYYTETLLKMIGYSYKGIGSFKNGTDAIKNYFGRNKINTGGMYIYDGSGISRANAISSQTVVELLSYIKNKSDYYETYKNTLSIAGKDGTLRNLCLKTSAQNRIFAKSGTMTRVLCYAGYAETLNGDTLIFSIFVNNYNCPTPQMRALIQRIMVKMVEWENIKTIEENIICEEIQSSNELPVM